MSQNLSPAAVVIGALRVNLLLGDFYGLMITFENGFYLEQVRHNVELYLDPNRS